MAKRKHSKGASAKKREPTSSPEEFVIEEMRRLKRHHFEQEAAKYGLTFDEYWIITHPELNTRKRREL